MHGDPLAVAGEELEAAGGALDEQREEVDVLVGRGAHGTLRDIRGHRRVMDEPQDAVAVDGHGGEVVVGQLEVAGDRAQGDERDGLERAVEGERHLAEVGDDRVIGPRVAVVEGGVLGAHGLLADVPELLEVGEACADGSLATEGDVAAVAPGGGDDAAVLYVIG